MRTIYFYKCKDKKELSKVNSMIFSFSGIEYVSTYPVSGIYAAFYMSDKLSRKIKMYYLTGNDKSKKISKLFKYINKSKKFKSEKEFNKFIKNFKVESQFRRNKNSSYDKMPKPDSRDNKRHVRVNGYNHTHGPSKYFCLECRFSFKSNDNFSYSFGVHVDKNRHCPNCGVDNSNNDKIVRLASHVRVPRKSASKYTWNNFINNFIDKK